MLKFNQHTLHNILWPLRLAQSALEVKNRELWDMRAFDSLNCESTYNLTDLQASIYDRKRTVRRFGTTKDIQQSLSLVRSQRPKYVNSAPSGTLTNETLWNRRVNNPNTSGMLVDISKLIMSRPCVCFKPGTWATGSSHLLEAGRKQDIPSRNIINKERNNISSYKNSLRSRSFSFTDLKKSANFQEDDFDQLQNVTKRSHLRYWNSVRLLSEIRMRSNKDCFFYYQRPGTL